MPYIILLSGFTASGKSTLSKYLSKKLKIKVLHSAIIRNELQIFVNEEESESLFDFKANKRHKMDDIVYSKIAQKAEVYIESKKSVIIDAGNFYKYRRKKYYDLCEKHRIKIINVICSDESLIKLRIENRLKNYKDSVFNEAASMKIYNSTKLIMENPMDDYKSINRSPHFFQYDTATNQLEIIYNNSNDFDFIIDLLKKYSFPYK